MNNDYFVNELKEMLKQDYSKFESTFNTAMYKALRVNTIKTDQQFVKENIDFCQQTPFDSNTYYLDEDTKAGKHPFHNAGLYYIQEPSATMVVNALAIEENDWVLDLCAAPGGKSTHILSKLNNTGFLWSNEYDHKRATTLLSNIERWGSDNYILTNNTVEQLCPMLKGLFDKIVVDAPCSGASMFKKYPESINEYNENAVIACANRQLHILECAYEDLKENGTLVYSTCTYNMIEDENVVEQFMKLHPDMQLVDSGLDCGSSGFDEKHYTRRVWPWQKGEGHFLAKMIKTSDTGSIRVKTLNYSSNPIVDAFLKENCNEKHHYTIIKDKVYISQKPLIDTKANVIRQAVLLGELVKGRLEPHHHFFITCKDIKKVYDITDDKQLEDYLSGLSLFVKGFKGYVQIRYKGIPIGFGKGDNSQIKNKYPKGLRMV